MIQKNFNHNAIEDKWQKKWKSTKLYKSDNNKNNKYYLLVELTYTSGDLHMGHWFAWCAPDALARMLRMQGKNVLFPVGGFDAFGLPAENAAIKHGINPREWTYKNIANMRKQFEKMGPSFDWDKEVITSDSDYYRWTQWLFIKLYKKGLAYRGKVWSNWCPECKTVLANEHVENGCCWRHTSTPVEQKLVDQWLFRITEYADKLIWPENPKVDWPQAALEGQNNWIGRKEGITISYPIENSSKMLDVWTSRPDTNFGATFIVIAPEHPLIDEIVSSHMKVDSDIKNQIKRYVDDSKNKLERERLAESRTKTGVFTGLYAINTLNNEKLPVWVSDFVIASFGTGAVVGVPGHDKRDFEFAKSFGIPIKRVVVGADGESSEIKKIDQVQENEGTMINSDFLNGLDIHTATQKIMDYIEEKGMGKRKVMYHLRDWSISRQRYWAAPVPVIYCEHCYMSLSEDKKRKLKVGTDYTEIDSKIYLVHTVGEDDLPVVLPENVDYTPTGRPPLATAEDWTKVTCPVCGEEARRDVETLDTYVDSSWYFFRYPTPDYDKGPFDPGVIKEWMPVKLYFGGPEHILGHTLYARFITKFLYDEGIIDFDEFALKRFHHGVILGSDGYRMSKSRGNVVNPDEQVEKFGADSVRLYINFLGPHDKGGAWKTEGIEGARRFLNRVWKLVLYSKDVLIENTEDIQRLNHITHKTIKKVSEDIEILHTHTAISTLMEYVNFLEDLKKSLKNNKADKGALKPLKLSEALSILVLLLAPFAPHLTEELWVEVLGKKYSVHKAQWPLFREELTKEAQTTLVVQVDGKVRTLLKMQSDLLQDKEKAVTAAKEEANIKKWLDGKKIKSTVFVPGRLINFVTS